MISIIIPILNEAETIEDLLFHLIDHSSLENISEIIVVDGGSTDGSQEIIKNLDLKIKLLSSPKGRAKQMNLGAKMATGDILYFLHADSFPPLHFDELIISEVKKGNNAGCFRLQFDSKHWWLRLASWLTQFSWRASRGGDQSQFITRALFDEIGGYDENYVIYEDNILINELYDRKEFVVINKKIKTSARLYRKHGVWKLQYHFWTIYVKKWFGASAEDLLTYYKKYIC
ncbi:TIGR04283 family arsenosugar biosynthesis glycosyltransferase [Psychroserpens sp. AS72]|uniref:TIGR04283 family arsenosugar biosynthesis glycosyltransferase n=1 Tax=Psychroserpens sp. AS72 TaxID=3135775 RepID=UPI00317FF543